jgi:hypothetical protein
MNATKHKLKDFDRNYIMQGMCKVDSYYLVSSYSKTKNSIISIFNSAFTLIKDVELYNNSHVGGICYDDIHKVIWVSDKQGTVSGYKKDDIFDKKRIEPISKFKKIKVGKDLINYKGYEAVSYLTYSNKKIYLGNFTITRRGELRCFDINKDGSINLKSEKVICKKFDNLVQGIQVIDDYILITKSFGGILPSRLAIYSFRHNRVKKMKEIGLPIYMAEAIVKSNDKLVIISESGANFFNNKTYTDYIEIPVDDIIM